MICYSTCAQQIDVKNIVQGNPSITRCQRDWQNVFVIMGAHYIGSGLKNMVRYTGALLNIGVCYIGVLVVLKMMNVSVCIIVIKQIQHARCVCIQLMYWLLHMRNLACCTDCTHLFDFWYISTSCINSIRVHFPYIVFSMCFCK